MPADESGGAVLSFLLQHTRRDHLGPEENIFAAGHVNSLFALQLIMFIEKNFQICIEQEDLDLANFCSVAAIQRFVLRKSVTTASERP